MPSLHQFDVSGEAAASIQPIDEVFQNSSILETGVTVQKISNHALMDLSKNTFGEQNYLNFKKRFFEKKIRN